MLLDSIKKIYSFTNMRQDFKKDQINLNFMWARTDVFNLISDLWKDSNTAEHLYRTLNPSSDKINVSQLMYYFSITQKIIYQPTNHFE